MNTTEYWKTAAGLHIKKFWASQTFHYFINLIREVHMEFTIKLRKKWLNITQEIQ